MIVKAVEEMRSEILELMLLAARSQVHKQWDFDESGYPCCNLDGDIASGNAYVIINDGKIAAYACLDTTEPEEYSGADWLRPQEGAIYVHRLCVHPHMRGKGYAKEFMRFSEELADKAGLKFIRLDSYSRNEAACSLYTSIGYTKISHKVYYLDRMPDPCYLFEKAL